MAIAPLPRLQSDDPVFSRFQDGLRQVLQQLTAPEPWRTPTLLNSWVNFNPANGSNNAIAGYTKDPLGFVHLRGSIKGGTIGAGTPVFILPDGHRPSRGQNFAIASNGAFGYVFVSPTGSVAVVVGSNVWADLDGITFDTR